MRALLHYGDTYVDVGANIGAHVVYGSHFVGSKGSVIAVEPVPEAISVLESIVSLNKLFNVKIYPYAIWQVRSGKIVRMSYRSSLTAFSKICKKGVPVRAYTLDEILRDVVKKVRLLKIDVEGSEVDVLRGAKKSLERTDAVIIEIRKETVQSCINILKKLGFISIHLFTSHGGPIGLFPPNLMLIAIKGMK